MDEAATELQINIQLFTGKNCFFDVKLAVRIKDGYSR